MTSLRCPLISQFLQFCQTCNFTGVNHPRGEQSRMQTHVGVGKSSMGRIDHGANRPAFGQNFHGGNVQWIKRPVTDSTITTMQNDQWSSQFKEKRMVICCTVAYSFFLLQKWLVCQKLQYLIPKLYSWSCIVVMVECMHQHKKSALHCKFSQPMVINSV